MREIVFRGKCADDGKWREKEYRDGKLYTGTECYDFIEGTACEWTGLNDENGRNIFEGDIVRDTEDNCIGVVKFGIYDNPVRADDDGGHLGFHIQWVEKIVMRRNDILFWADKIKVIGNIFDNQELIDQHKELEVYRSIGTVDELRRAKDQQIPKMVTHESSVYKCLTCPTCKNVVDEFTTLNGEKVRVTYKYCRFCGQALKWEE